MWAHIKTISLTINFVFISITLLYPTFFRNNYVYGQIIDPNMSSSAFEALVNEKINRSKVETVIPFIESDLTPVKETKIESNIPQENPLNIVPIKTEEVFEELINQSDFLLLLFTAPWCGMSKRALDQINEMIEYFNISKPILAENPDQPFYSKNFSIGLVSVPELPNLVKRLNVSDYPTIKLVKKGDKLRIIDFYGNIYHKKLLFWIIKQIHRLENNSKTQMIKLSTFKDLKFFIETGGYSIVYLHDSDSDRNKNSEYLLLVEICKVYDDINFGESNSNDLEKSISTEDNIQLPNVTELIKYNKGSRLLFFNSGKFLATLEGPLNEESRILNAIDYYRQENVIFLNKDTIGDIIDYGESILLLIFNGNSENYMDELNKETSTIFQFYTILQKVISIRNEKASKLNKNTEKRPLFVISGNEGPINRRFMDFLHITDDLLPLVLLVKDLNVSPPKKYYLDLPKIHLSKLEGDTGTGDRNGLVGSEILSIGKSSDSNWIILNNNTSINFSPTIISDFIDEVKSGVVNNTFYSQVAPSKQSGPVYILVGNTFKDIVHDANRDVLVLFYTPWCGHCKTFDPIYNDVANIVTSKTNVLVAKIDMSANYVPDDYIGGKIFRFPTIKLFKKKDKQNPIDFDGERESSSILDFVWIHTARDEL
ncbi:Thioredoxin family protein [Cryptosporidium felis]|nr:Thioredoxin family protein [Cryptosporidium felis]